MGFAVFVGANDGWPTESDPVKEGYFHFFEDDFVFELESGNVQILYFSEIEEIPWVAVGGMIMPDIICGALSLKCEQSIILYMSMKAQRALMPIISNPRMDTETGMYFHNLFTALVEREGGKPWKKELIRTLKQEV